MNSLLQSEREARSKGDWWRYEKMDRGRSLSEAGGGGDAVQHLVGDEYASAEQEGTDLRVRTRVRGFVRMCVCTGKSAWSPLVNL